MQENENQENKESQQNQEQELDINQLMKIRREKPHFAQY